MKKIIISVIGFIITLQSASAYQILSSKEYGSSDARNQNVVVKCTTETGKISTETCSLRRYIKCTGSGTNMSCSGWQPWRDLRNPQKSYNDWKSAASACCRAKGLR
ncbi:MAG: hypothetical protein ACLRFI_00675 [Alphaproteobacteria bacterium]